MCKNFLAVLLVFCCLFGACAQSKKTTKSSGANAPTKTSSAKSLRGLTSVTMRRGACFGRCPEYSLTIQSDGLVKYVSKRNAQPEGSFEKNIGADKARKLLQQFMDNRADTCADRYQPIIADLPGLDYKLMINGKEKPIYNANFGPSYLSSLSLEMDAIGKVDSSWKKVAEQKAEE